MEPSAVALTPPRPVRGLVRTPGPAAPGPLAREPRRPCRGRPRAAPLDRAPWPPGRNATCGEVPVRPVRDGRPAIRGDVNSTPSSASSSALNSAASRASSASLITWPSVVVDVAAFAAFFSLIASPLHPTAATSVADRSRGSPATLGPCGPPSPPTPDPTCHSRRRPDAPAAPIRRGELPPPPDPQVRAANW